MLESTVTAKGHTTLPLQVRTLASADHGTRLVRHPMPDGRFELLQGPFFGARLMQALACPSPHHRD